MTNCTCNMGYTGPDGLACAACVAGTYKDVNGSSACSLCLQGKFSTGLGAIHADVCELCPANAISGAGSPAIANCTCTLGYSGPDGGPCQPCAAGRYKDVNGSDACALCPQGTFSTEVAAVSDATCSTCPNHTYSDDGSSNILNCTCNLGYTGPDGQECSACQSGKYKDVNGSSACLLCSRGKYSAETGEAAETTCTACPMHADALSGSSVCICNAGYTGPDGQNCSACASGRYKEENGSAPCSLCLQGKYSTETGETSEATCSACPAHTYSGSGSSDMTNCTCNMGYTGPDGLACVACVAGTYKDVNGSSACSLCQQGKYSTGLGEVAELVCSDCPASSSSAEGSDRLVNCSCIAGYSGLDGQACIACVPGKYKQASGPSDCLLCGAGKYSTGSGADDESLCLGCPFGSSSVEGSSVLENCACNAGYTGSNGQVCSVCLAGKHKAAVGPSDCLPCVAGTWSAELGKTDEVCTSCPDDSISAESSSEKTGCLCNMGYSGPDGGPCDACEPGTFKPVKGSDTCDVCSAGFYSELAAARACTSCPNNSWTAVEASSLQEDCLCNAGFTGQNGGDCVVCEAGKAKKDAGSAACDECLADQFSATGATNCTNCPANSVAPALSTVVTACQCSPGHFGSAGGPCEECAAGTYTDTANNIACSECGAGTYQNSTKATECLVCRPDTFATGNASIVCLPCNTECLAGQFRATECTTSADTICVECPNGTYSTAGTNPDVSSCRCQAGSVGPAGGPCEYCPPDTYSNGSSCAACPVHSAADQGASSRLACTCQAGYSGPDGGDCKACAAGKFKHLPGPLGCEACPTGTYSSKIGAVTAATCVACPSNSLSPLASAGANLCLCNAGYAPAGSTCSACAAGTYKQAVGTDSCTACGQASTSDAASVLSSQCVCNTGYTGPNGGTCVACDSGTYKNKKGSDGCAKCPASSTSSRAAEMCVCNAGYSKSGGALDGAACTACEAGKYSDATTTTCKSCPESSFSMEASASCNCEGDLVRTVTGKCVDGNTPVKINVVAIVEMSRAEFEATQNSYLEGLAAAAGVDPLKVSIVSVEEVALRRRSGLRMLLAAGVEVTSAVETTAANSEVITSAVSGDAVREQMASRGFKVEVKGVEAQEPSAEDIAAASQPDFPLWLLVTLISAGGVIAIAGLVYLTCKMRAQKPRAEEAAEAEMTSSITATMEGEIVSGPPGPKSASLRPPSAPEEEAGPSLASPVSRSADRRQLVASPQNLLPTLKEEESPPAVGLRLPNVGSSSEPTVVVSGSEEEAAGQGEAPPVAATVAATSFIVPPQQATGTTVAGLGALPEQAAHADQKPARWLYESLESHGDKALPPVAAKPFPSVGVTAYSDIIHPVLRVSAGEQPDRQAEPGTPNRHANLPTFASSGRNIISNLITPRSDVPLLQEPEVSPSILVAQPAPASLAPSQQVPSA